MSLIFREVQTKTTRKYHLIYIWMVVIKKQNKTQTASVKDIEKLEPLCAAGNIKWFSLYGKTVWWYLKNLKIGLSHDPAIPLWVFVQKN